MYQPICEELDQFRTRGYLGTSGKLEFCEAMVISKIQVRSVLSLLPWARKVLYTLNKDVDCC